jgi:hypothetical protein
LNFVLSTGLDEDFALKKAMEDSMPWTECVKVFVFMFCFDFLLFVSPFLLCENNLNLNFNLKFNLQIAIEIQTEIQFEIAIAIELEFQFEFQFEVRFD